MAHQAALALEGGGLRSVAVDAGLTAGLLAACNTPNLKASKLFDRFGTISTVSGGSWFLASLVYSHEFADMLEAIAHAPEKAASLFHERWTAKLLAIGAGANPILKKLEECSATLPCHCACDKPLALLEDVILIRYERETGKTWQHFVETLLRETADIGRAALLGGEDVNAWSVNKVWLCNHSIVTPSNRGSTFFWKQHCGIGNASYHFKPETEVKLPPFLPAKCSVRLGAGTNSVAPETYVSKETPALLGGLRYSAVTPSGGIFSCCNASHLEHEANVDFSLLEKQAGKLSVVDCVASSSAALGVLEGIAPGELGNILNAVPILHDAHMWVASTACDATQVFSEGSAAASNVASGGAVTSQALELLAEKGVYDTCDGGAVDNTGIAAAVSAGAKDVVVVLNDPEPKYDPYPKALLTLFSKAVLTPDKNLPGLLFHENPYRIFSSPSVQEVKTAWDNFSVITPRTKGVLKSIRIGTLPKARTVRNPWLGTEDQPEDGHHVTIHVVQVECDYTTFGNDFHDGNQLVAELVTVIGENKNVVHEELMPMFFGKEVVAQEAAAVEVGAQEAAPVGDQDCGHESAYVNVKGRQDSCLPWPRLKHQSAAAAGA